MSNYVLGRPNRPRSERHFSCCVAIMEHAVSFYVDDRVPGHLPSREAPTRLTGNRTFRRHGDTDPVPDDHESGESPSRSTDVADDLRSRRSFGFDIGGYSSRRLRSSRKRPPLNFGNKLINSNANTY